jgi:hypothetical protein
MKNPQRNQRIRVIRSGRGYEPGKTYTVTKVDPSDNTLIAADSGGNEGSWLKWDQCILAGPNISWDWLKTQLPSEVLELLTAFNGLETLTLKPEVRDYILSQLPNLKDRILQAQVALDEQFGGEPLSAPEPSEMEDAESDMGVC